MDKSTGANPGKEFEKVEVITDQGKYKNE